MGGLLINAPRRFWAKVRKTDSCWLWTGALRDGYGIVTLASRGQQAHRVSYEWVIGPIPVGLQIDHLCRVRNCVNPAHMEVVTQRENVMRGVGQPWIAQRAKTHCPANHPYAGNNLVVHRGKRYCRQCQRAAQARYAARKRAGAAA